MSPQDRDGELAAMSTGRSALAWLTDRCPAGLSPQCPSQTWRARALAGQVDWASFRLSTV